MVLCVWSIADDSSFFGTQEGDFSLSITSIAAYKKSDTKALATPYRDDPNRSELPLHEKSRIALRDHSQQRGWFAWFFGFCGGS